MDASDPVLARLIDQVAGAHEHAAPLEICGGGTKRFYGELPAGAPMNHPLFPVLWCLQP